MRRDTEKTDIYKPRRREQSLPSQSSDGTNPADILISDAFKPPELWDSAFLFVVVWDDNSSRFIQAVAGFWKHLQPCPFKPRGGKDSCCYSLDASSSLWASLKHTHTPTCSFNYLQLFLNVPCVSRYSSLDYNYFPIYFTKLSQGQDKVLWVLQLCRYLLGILHHS